jgi:hypothetical protein
VNASRVATRLELELIERWNPTWRDLRASLRR